MKKIHLSVWLLIIHIIAQISNIIFYLYVLAHFLKLDNSSEKICVRKMPLDESIFNAWLELLL